MVFWLGQPKIASSTTWMEILKEEGWRFLQTASNATCAALNLTMLKSCDWPEWRRTMIDPMSTIDGLKKNRQNMIMLMIILRKIGTVASLTIDAALLSTCFSKFFRRQLVCISRE